MAWIVLGMWRKDMFLSDPDPDRKFNPAQTLFKLILLILCFGREKNTCLQIAILDSGANSHYKKIVIIWDWPEKMVLNGQNGVECPKWCRMCSVRFEKSSCKPLRPDEGWTKLSDELARVSAYTSILNQCLVCLTFLNLSDLKGTIII